MTSEHVPSRASSMGLRAHSAGLMSRVLISIGAIQLLIMFVALVRAKVLSVLLGPSGFGVVGAIDQATLTAMQLAHLSLPFTALKFMSRRHSDGHDAFERTYASFFRALLWVALLAVIVLEGLLWWRPGVFGAELVEYRRYFAIAFLGIPSLMLNVLLINALAAAQRGAAGALVNLVIGAVAATAAIVGVTLGGFGGLYVASVLSALAATAGVVWYLHHSLRLSITSPGARLRDELRRTRRSWATPSTSTSRSVHISWRSWSHASSSSMRSARRRRGCSRHSSASPSPSAP